MPFVIKRITLNRAALLSVVDKGASGDDDNRPSIVLFKRKVAKMAGKPIHGGVEKMTKLGDYITRIAGEKEKTVKEISQAAGIDDSTMSQIMRGEIKDPPSERISAIARELGVPVKELTSRIPKELQGGGPGGRESDEPQEKRMDGLAAKIGAIDEQNFNDEQKAFVLKLLEASMGGSPAPEAPPIVEAPAEKAEGDEEDPADEDPKPEEEEMTKRHKEQQEENIALQKRINKLEADAETVVLNKRADELKFLPMKHEETVALLKRIGDDKASLEMLAKLSKASEKSPLLKAAGAVVQDGDGSAQATLNKRVKVLQDKDPDLNTDAAEMRVLKSDDKLYTEIRRERN